jgi:hypothetical protein
MKTIASLVITFMTATLLSLGVSAPAQAACDGYGPCIDTRLSAWPTRNPIKARQRIPFTVRLKAETGASPNAQLRIRVIRRGNGKVVWSGRRFYDGGFKSYSTGRVGRGRYRVVVRAHTVRNRFQDARAVFGVRAQRR